MTATRAKTAWQAANLSVACNICGAALGELCRVPPIFDCACAMCRAIARKIRAGDSFCGGGARELAALHVPETGDA